MVLGGRRLPLKLVHNRLPVVPQLAIFSRLGHLGRRRLRAAGGRLVWGARLAIRRIAVHVGVLVQLLGLFKFLSRGLVPGGFMKLLRGLVAFRSRALLRVLRDGGVLLLLLVGLSERFGAVLVDPH